MYLHLLPAIHHLLLTPASLKSEGCKELSMSTLRRLSQHIQIIKKLFSVIRLLVIVVQHCPLFAAFLPCQAPVPQSIKLTKNTSGVHQTSGEAQPTGRQQMPPYPYLELLFTWHNNAQHTTKQHQQQTTCSCHCCNTPHHLVFMENSTHAMSSEMK